MSVLSLRTRSLWLAAAAVTVIHTPSLAQTTRPLPEVVVNPTTTRPSIIRGSSKSGATRRARTPRVYAPPPAAAAPIGEAPVVNTSAGPVQGYRALTATSASRTSTPIERIPQNVAVIPRTVIDAQSTVSVSEAVRNASNVQPLDTRVVGNVEQAPYRVRGFPAEIWIDGFPGNLFTAGDRDSLVNVERIEVLKGPNAILYGGGAGAPLGGTINLISKMPLDKARYEIGGTFGSFGYWSPNFDVNQPLNAEKTALFRMTGEYTGSKSFIDVLDIKRYNVNPTLTLTNREDTSLTLQGFMSSHQQQAYPGLPVDGTLFGAYRIRREAYIGNPNIEPSYAKIHGLTATFDHRFNEVWSTNIKARWSQSELKQNAQVPLFDATFTGGTPIIPPSTFDLNNSQVFDQQREFSISPTVQAKFAAGPTQNTLLIGGEYSRVSDKGFHNIDPGVGFVDLANPVYTVPFTPPQPGVGFAASFFDFDNTYITKGIFTQLQSSVYERVHFMGGLRLASLDMSYTEKTFAPPVTFVTDETKLLPRAGVVVDLFKGLSVFASYSEGMKWVPFSQTFAQPKPETSAQLEGGVKFNVNDKLTGTLAVFNIERNDVPFRISPIEGALSRQRSRGFEADTVFQPNWNWSVLASYGYTDAIFVDSPGGGVSAGNKVNFVPEHSGRIWAMYRFDPHVAPGWSVGAGVYLASSQFVDPANLYRTSGYYTVDAKIGYETQNFRVALTFKNLTGEEYFTPYNWFNGQVAPSAPRAIYGQISYKFN